jgi:hypothetical protein
MANAYAEPKELERDERRTKDVKEMPTMSCFCQVVVHNLVR